jgi:catechol 2,3-dioxygenase-like lactoylglutathione lyase family enzyme
MLGLRHLALKVHDIERSLDFYTRILGMRVDWRPDEWNVYLTCGSDNLALHQSEEPVSGRGMLDHFGFMVARPEEVDEWALRLARFGIALVQAPKNHRDGSRSLYFHDPDENLIQLLFYPRLAADQHLAEGSPG